MGLELCKSHVFPGELGWELIPSLEPGRQMCGSGKTLPHQALLSAHQAPWLGAGWRGSSSLPPPSCHGDLAQGCSVFCCIQLSFCHLSTEQEFACPQVWKIPELLFHLRFHFSVLLVGPRAQGSSFKEV